MVCFTVQLAKLLLVLKLSMEMDEAMSITSSVHVSDASIAKPALKCCNLQELGLSSCHEISHESLLVVGNNCPNLKILKRNFMNWVDSSEHVRMVPNEDLNACPRDGDSQAAAIGKFMPGLEHLELKFSKLTAKGLALIAEGCVQLQCLNLFGCVNSTRRNIANVEEKLKKLTKIEKPNYYIPRSVYQVERYGHWQLCDERFQTDVFRI